MRDMASPPDPERERIDETTVGQINGMSVGIGTIREREFQDADGSTRRVMSARISIWEGDGDSVDIFAPTGSVLEIGQGQRWRLIEVVESLGDALGRVTFERVRD